MDKFTNGHKIDTQRNGTDRHPGGFVILVIIAALTYRGENFMYIG
jgi:hypothetical protein